jgi:ABC-2 type transport system ATP-binding protein
VTANPAAAGQAIIRAESLSRSFADVQAVAGFTASIAAGEIFGLVGPDGAGKTTLMRLLTGILPPSAGEAWVCGFHVVREGEARKERIGYMSQRFGLYPDLTVLENIEFYADIYGVTSAQRAERLESLLAFSNLTPFRRRRAANLSGGMKQKLGLACALIHTPRVLFLDEPTNGVDPVSRRDFWRILYQLLRQGVTILVSTSYLDEAERCSRVGMMHQGKLLAAGTPAEVKTMMRGSLLEIRTAEPRRAVEALRGQLATDALGLFGDRVHAVVQDADAARAAIPRLLAAAGLSADDVRVIEPALEDVFISVLAEREADAGG